MKTLNLFSAVASIALMGSFAQAQVITWGPATDVSTVVGNSSDVSNTGTLVEAYNGVANDVFAGDELSDPPVPPAGPITVNGVVFTPTTSLLNADPKNSGFNTDFSVGTNDGDAEYDSLISTLEYGGGTDLVNLVVGDGDGDGSVTGAGLLTVGNNYQIQVWYVDDRPNQDARETPVGDANGNVVTLNDQFAIGAFTADGTTLAITLESPEFGQAHITAYQIRDVTNSSVLLGDVNLDGTVDFLDISPFIAVLSASGTQAEADCNQDGAVDFLDISPFIALLSGN